MGREHPEAVGIAPAGGRNALQFGQADTATDAGHHRYRQAVCFGVDFLFLPPAEDERVSPFQPNRVAVLVGGSHQQLVNLVLLFIVAAGTLTHEDTGASFGCLLQQFVRAQCIVEHYVGRLQGFEALAGDEVGVAGAGAYEGDSRSHAFVFCWVEGLWPDLRFAQEMIGPEALNPITLCSIHRRRLCRAVLRGF